jgi:hypothetical protein
MLLALVVVVLLLLFACTLLLLLLLLPLLIKVLLLMVQAPVRVPTHLQRGAHSMHSIDRLAMRLACISQHWRVVSTDCWWCYVLRHVFAELGIPVYFASAGCGAAAGGVGGR